MLERKILSSLFIYFYFIFFSQLIELFHRTMKKKIKNPAKYELLLPEPLTLTLF